MIIGQDGLAVVLDARACAWLEHYAGLSSLRVRVRGTDPAISRQLEELRVAADSWTCSLPSRTAVATTREQAAPSQYLTTSEAAEVLQIGARGVQQAIARGLLPAKRVGRCYQISRADLEHYRAARAA